MIIQPIQITQNDYGYQIPFTLEDGLGNAVDLDGASLVLNVQSSQDPSSELIALSGSMATDNASAGTCHYAVALGDFTAPGTLLAQITATYGSEVLTWTGITIIVMPALPKAMN